MKVDYYVQLRNINNALRLADRYHIDRAKQIYRTGLVESDFLYDVDKAGTAFSYFQIELTTAQSLFFDTYPNIAKHDGMWDLPIAVFAGVKLPFNVIKAMLTKQNLNIWGTYIPIWLCDMKYRTVAEPIPPHTDLKAQAKYWKQYYNTTGGVGSVSYFVDKVYENEKLILKEAL